MAKYLYLSALLSALVALACSSPPYRPNAQYLPGIHDSVLVHGLHYPWDLVWGADGHIWMTERHGRISRVNPVNGKVQLLLEVPGVVARGEGGLLGMALHPSFADTPQLFVACNYLGTKGYAEKIIRYTYDGSGLVDPVVIFDHIEAAYIHNGCRLLILPDRTLLFSTGDAANQSLPQNKESVNGKLLRIHLDGSIPANNPFPNSPVWSYGHRNAQGLVMANSILYSSEHGPDTDDELNILEKGRNYGWPKVHGFCDRGGEKAFCKTNDVLAPIYAWTPTIAVCGLDYYGEGPIQQWRHSLLMATLKDATLYQLQLDSSGRSIQKVDTYFSDKYGRLRDVCVAPNGQVYLCTSNGGNEDKLVVVKAAP